MIKSPLNEQDQVLIAMARTLIARRKQEERHAVSCALRTVSGETFLGLHLEAYVGRVAVCAESVAIGNAAISGDQSVETIVSVYQNGTVVAPCGICRELISDYGPEAQVILFEAGAYYKVSIKELIPFKYERTPMDQ